MDKLLLTFKALSDRNRLRIVAALLQHGELCGCQLIELLGVAGATASRHLSQLQTAGILTGRKDGRWNFFRVADDWRSVFPLEWLERKLTSSRALAGDREAMVKILAQRPVDICRRQRGGGSSLQRMEVQHAKTKILFLCTGNSCRSQMAEGWARQLHGDVIEASSAGIETHGNNAFAVKVMAESGVDISSQYSKLIDTFDLADFDAIITVCDHAHESCPLVPSPCRVIHQGFDDPPRLAEALVAEEEKLDCYRRVRDEIRAYVATLPGQLPVKGE